MASFKQRNMMKRSKNSNRWKMKGKEDLMKKKKVAKIMMSLKIILNQEKLYRWQ